MRNKFKGTCYRCGLEVNKGNGHYERYKGRWLTQHSTCAILHRGTNVSYNTANPTKTPTNKIVRRGLT